MKFDTKEPLTPTQYEKLKGSTNLRADLATVLPETKAKRLQPFINDPDYLILIVRPYNGQPAHLLLRLPPPRRFVSLPTRLANAVKKAAKKIGQTKNQFIKSAIMEMLPKGGT